jgi:hypothetical protein
VLKDKKTLVPMQPASFVSEDDFQRLLAEFPLLLSGDLIDAASPRRWLLISREKSIPSDEGGGGRWALDHLFIDQDAVPTLVEVKRQTDTRLRREVVGQMMDYAANATVYWPVEELRREFEARCVSEDRDPTDEIHAALGINGDADDLWQRVKTNLQAGRVRLLFVADHIPSELRRVVEFLNQQMDPAEVLALELRQFEGEGLKTLVPVVYGQTEVAQQKKSAGGPKRQWDEASIYDDMERRAGSDAVNAAKKLVAWMKTSGNQVGFGFGSRDGSIHLMVLSNEQRIWPLFVRSNGKVEVSFGLLAKSPNMDEQKRGELLARLNRIQGIKLPIDAITKYPTIPLSALADEKRMLDFVAAMNWTVQQLRAGSASAASVEPG